MNKFKPGDLVIVRRRSDVYLGKRTSPYYTNTMLNWEGLVLEVEGVPNGERIVLKGVPYVWDEDWLELYRPEPFHVYIAGSLFSEAEVAQRISEERQIEHKLKFYKEAFPELYHDLEVEIFNPISQPFNDKSEAQDARDIFLGDTRAMHRSDFILMNLDNSLDSGVFTELGQLIGLEYHAPKPGSETTPSKSGPENEAAKEGIEMHKRKIFPVISDMRMPTAGDYTGEAVPWGMNQYVRGAILTYDEYAVFHTRAQDAIDSLVGHILLQHKRRTGRQAKPLEGLHTAG